MKLYQHLARTLLALRNCQKTGNTEWQRKHSDAIDRLCRDFLPHGSGFDQDTYMSDASTPQKMIFNTAFHHMNSHGYYDGWTYHKVIVTPDLAHGFDVRVTGRDRNDIKDYIAESFQMALDDSEGYEKTGFDRAYENTRT